MTRITGRAGWIVASLVLALTVAACTGVPASSGPQIVRTIGLGESPPPSAPAPPAGADQSQIVSGFLDAMRTSPVQLDAAKAYLDTEAASSWTGTTVTIVRSPYLVGTPNSDNTVQVNYQAIGSLSADGVYSPATFDGRGEAEFPPATYSLARNAAGEWRIHTPVPPGLILTDTDFERLYNAKALYFLDTAGSRLVPDLRYSALPDPSLETYLLTQLAVGPRNDLKDAVTPFAPSPTGNQRLSVTLGTPTVVQIPGAEALDDQSRTDLAAQVAFTLRTTSFQSELQIQDGTRVVGITGVGDSFDYTDFSALAPVDDTDSTTATYVRDGGVVTADGTPLSGKLGNGAYDLDSAVFDSDGGRTLIAGTTGTTGDDGSRRLLVGDASEMQDVAVPAGPLTAPAWAPVGTRSDTDEVWVASGSTVYRFVPGVRGARPSKVTVAGANTITGTVVSLAFSPEGSRLALVIRSPDGSTSQVWLAAVVRNGQDVRLVALDRVTPSDYQITDLGWRSDIALAAVGTAPGQPNGVYLEVNVDGSRLDAAPPDGLPERPRTIAVSPRATTQWVTVGTGSQSTVWTKTTTARSWSTPGGGSLQSGEAPSFST